MYTFANFLLAYTVARMIPRDAPDWPVYLGYGLLTVLLTVLLVTTLTLLVLLVLLLLTVFLVLLVLLFLLFLLLLQAAVQLDGGLGNVCGAGGRLMQCPLQILTPRAVRQNGWEGDAVSV